MTRVIPRKIALTFVFSAVLAFGCLSAGTPMGVEYKSRTQFESEWSKYLDLAPNKAMAIAGDVRGRYVLGYAYLFPTEASAIEEALAACEWRLEDRSIEDPCRLFAIDDVRVDANPTTDAPDKPIHESR